MITHVDRLHAGCALLLAALVAFGPVRGATAQERAEDLFQRALRTERVSGDLEVAIDLYRQVVQSGDRTLGARALIRIAESYEKLGRDGAREAYSQVLSDFADQGEQVAVARERLSVIDREAPAVTRAEKTSRMLLNDETLDLNHFFEMEVSPDGRRLASIDAGYTGAVIVRDLASGEATKVADGWAFSPVWSPDGNRLAYSRVTSPSPLQITPFILDLSTGVETAPPALEGKNLTPIAWSPDGLRMVVGVGGMPMNRSMALVTVATGEMTELSPTEVFNSADFSPDSHFLAYSTASDDNTDVYVMDVRTGEQTRITSAPTREIQPRWSPAGDVLVYTVEDGGVWAVPMHGGDAAGAPRLLSSENGVQPAGWARTGQFFYVRYNLVGQLLRVPVDRTTMASTGPPEALAVQPDAVGWFRWSPDMRRIATCGGASMRGIEIYSVDGELLETFDDAADCRFAGIMWSDDGARIYFADQKENGAYINELDLGARTVRALFPEIPLASVPSASADLRKMVFNYGEREEYRRQVVISDFGEAEGAVMADEASMTNEMLARWVRPQLTRDGSLVLFGTQRRPGTEGTYKLWIRKADGSDAPRMIAEAGWIPYATWDPDGRYVAYVTWEEHETGPSRLFVVDTRSGEQREIALPAGLETIQVMDWSHDGKYIGVNTSSGSHELWVTDNILGSRLVGL